jgi:hypothetical protein
MTVLGGAPLEEGHAFRDFLFMGMCAKGRVLLGCPSCGWWRAYYLDASAPHLTHDGGYAHLRCSSGVLKNLDLTDLSIPTIELRNYILAKYRDRFDVHPRKSPVYLGFELVSGAVL